MKFEKFFFEVIFWIAFPLSLFFSGAEVIGGENSLRECFIHYKEKRYLRAARCFEKLERELSRKKSGSLKVKYLRGKLLKNAARAFYLSGERAEGIREGVFYKRKAIELLRKYLREKLYQVDYQRQSAELQLLKWEKELGRAVLTVISGASDAEIVIKGYKFEERVRGRFSKSLYPGVYRITVIYRGDKRTWGKEVFLKPDHPLILNFGKEHQKPPSVRGKKLSSRVEKTVRSGVEGKGGQLGIGSKGRPAPFRSRKGIPSAVGWILFSVGLAAAIGGGVALGAAKMADSDRKEFFTKKNSNLSLLTVEDSKQFVSMTGTVSTLYSFGAISVGLGLLSAAVGGGLLILREDWGDKERVMAKPRALKSQSKAAPQSRAP